MDGNGNAEARKSLPVVSLFSGSGGLDLGFAQADFSPVVAIDTFDAARRTYQKNHCPDEPRRVLDLDLATIEPGDILQVLDDVDAQEAPVGVIGGPPCQAFSVSNVHKTDDDPRAKLPFSYATILEDLVDAYEIDFFLFENVEGLSSQHSDEFDEFKRLFSSAGFRIFEGKLDALDFGVPQMRERVFVVGLNRSRYPDVEFDYPTGETSEPRTVGDAIRELPEPKHFEYGLEPEDIPLHPNHWCMRPMSEKFENGGLEPGTVKGRSFRVLAWDQPSWTVAYGHREVHVHPSGKRRLSIFEAMRLQGFPDTYQLVGNMSEQVKLISDAVPPPVGRALAESIREVITPRSQMELFSEAATARAG